MDYETGKILERHEAEIATIWKVLVENKLVKPEAKNEETRSKE